MLMAGSVREKWLPNSFRGLVRAPRKRGSYWKGALTLGCCGSGKWPDSGKSPKVVRRGCKRSFGAREQKSQKGLLHHQNLVLHQCNPAFHGCKRDLARLRPKAFCTLSQPLWGDFPKSDDLPGPQLPNSYRNKFQWDDFLGSCWSFHLPFLVFFENGEENHPKNKDFLSLPNP